MKKDIPIVNKTYYFYEDGKISKTRQKTDSVLDVTNELTNELNERIKRINNSDKD